MVMSLRERLDAEARKKAEAAAQPKPAPVALAAPVAVSAPQPPPVSPKPVGRLAALLRKPGVLAVVTTAKAPTPQPVKAPPSTAVIQPAATTQATKVETPPPVADLPDTELAQFRAHLTYLEEHIEQKELIGQVVRQILMMWRKNPQFSSSMSNADEDIVARGFMRAFNVAARRKTEDQGKRTAKKATVSELDELMRGAGFGVESGGDSLGKMFGG